MAKGDSSPSPSPTTFPVFIDTNVDTHLAMVVQPEDTVADLKGKIKTEHSLCFPNIGEITVQAIKIRRRASFYHLSDSMLVRRAFDGIKGTWFLHLDIVSISSLVNCQTTGEDIASESGGQPKNHDRVPKEGTASMLLESSAGRNHGFLMNGHSAEKDLIPTDIPAMRESQALPDTFQHKSSVQGDSSLPNAGVSSNGQLVFGDTNADALSPLNQRGSDLHDSFGVSLSELDKRSDTGIQKFQEPVSEGNAIMGSTLHPIKELLADQGEKNGREEGRGNSGAVVDGGDTGVVASGGNYAVVANGGASGVVANDEGGSVAAIQKEKSRKRGSALHNDELLERISEHPQVEKKKRKKEKGTSFMKPVDDQITEHNFDSGGVSNKQTSELEKILPKTSSQDKHEISLPSAEGFSGKSPYVDSSMQQNPIDDKHTKKKKKRSSKSHEVAHSRLADENETNVVPPLGKQAGVENHELVSNHTDIGKVPDAADLINEGIHKVNVGDSVQQDTIAASTRTVQKQASAEFATQVEVTNVNPEGALDGNLSALSKDSNTAVMLKEVEQIRNPAEVVSEVPAKSRRSKKKSKSDATTLIKNDALHSPVKHANEENVQEAYEKNPKLLSKESDTKTIIGEEFVNKCTARIDLGISSVINAGSPSRRKISKKVEASNPLSDSQEIVDSARDQVTEENSTKTSGIHLGYPDKESHEAAVVRDAALVGNSTGVGSTVPSNPNEKKPKRRRKKSEKTEVPHQEPITSESVHTLVREASKENPRESLENNVNEITGNHLGHPDNLLKRATISGDAAVVGNVATVQSTVPVSLDDKKSKRSRKKSRKIEVPNQESIKDKIDHSSGKELTYENLEKGSGITTKGSHNDSKSATSHDETAQILGHAMLLGVDSTGFVIDSLNMHGIAHPSVEKAAEESEKGLLEKTSEKYGKESVNNKIDSGYANSSVSEDHGEPPKSDSERINFMDYFVPKASQHEPVASTQELPPMETETLKTNKEKTKRKKKLPLPQDSAPDLLNRSISDEQHMPNKKHQDGDSGNPDAPVQPVSEEFRTKKTHKKKTVKKTHKSDLHLHDVSSDFGSLRKSDTDDRPQNKLQAYVSDSHHQESISMDERSKHLQGKNSTNTDNKLQSPPACESSDTVVSNDGIPQNKDLDAFVKFHVRDSVVAGNKSDVDADASTEETMADKAISSDSTGEDTPIIKKQYRVAVRKIPTKRFQKVNKSNEENKLLDASATIFDGAMSGSSEDEFEVTNRHATTRAASDGLSMSADSEGVLDETGTPTSLPKPQAYTDSPGAGSTANHKIDKKTNGGLNTWTQSPIRRKKEPLSMILKNSVSYKKAKLTASQSEFEDTESQPVDIVFETQPE